MQRNSALSETIIVCTLMIFLGAAAQVLAQSSTSKYIDDATISTKVRAAFIEDSTLKGTNLSVETDQGSVILTGLVNTKTQKNEAVQVVRQVDGIKNVQDHLTIRSVQSQSQ